MAALKASSCIITKIQISINAGNRLEMEDEHEESIGMGQMMTGEQNRVR